MSNTVTLDQFATASSPYQGLFGKYDEISDYYNAYQNGVWFVCGRVIRSVVRSLGYANVLNACRTLDFSALRGIVNDEDAKLLESDLVVVLQGGLFGGRLNGLFDLRNLVELDEGGKPVLVPDLLNIITRDFIENYLVPLANRSSLGKGTGWDALNAEIERRQGNDATSVFFRFAARQVQKTAGSRSKFGVYPGENDDEELLFRMLGAAKVFVEWFAPGEMNLGRISSKEALDGALLALKDGIGVGLYDLFTLNISTT
jgi:hypothetical protein